MPDEHKVEYIGYRENDVPYRWERRLTRYMDSLATKLGIDVRVEYVAGQSIPERAEEFDDRKCLVIYDFGTRNFSTRIQNTYTFQYTDAGGRRRNADSYGTSDWLTASDITPAEDIFKARDDSRITMAEVDYLTVWMHCPIYQFNYLDEQTLKLVFEPILKRATAKSKFKKRKKERETRLKDGLTSALSDRAEKALENTRKQITLFETEAHNAHDNNLKAHAKLKKEANKLTFLDTEAQSTKESHQKQIEALMSNPQYSNITIINGELCIETRELYIYSPNKVERVPLGRFRIKLNLSNNRITTLNLTKKRGGRHHPHVNETGLPCWGAMSTPVAKLATSGEFVGLFSMVVMYLEKYSPVDDYGKFAGYWFGDKEALEYKQEDGTYAKTKPSAKTKKETEQVVDTEQSGQVDEAALGIPATTTN